MRHSATPPAPSVRLAPTPAIQAFTAGAEALHERAATPTEPVDGVRARLSTLVSQPNLYWPEQREP